MSELAKDICEMVVKDYGTTDNLKRIGFIMPDGRATDFSCGSQYGRKCSHSDVGMYIYNQDPKANEDKSPWVLLREWQNICGAVRVVEWENEVHFDSITKPTLAQRKKMRELAKEREHLSLERMDVGDNSVCRVPYQPSRSSVIGLYVQECFKDG